MKIVINRCYGGFSISRACATYMAARGHRLAAMELAESAANNGRWYGYGPTDTGENYARTDPLLIEAVETLGTQTASGEMARLEVVHVPDSIEWVIEEIGGFEHVAEKHRHWP